MAAESILSILDGKAPDTVVNPKAIDHGRSDFYSTGARSRDELVYQRKILDLAIGTDHPKAATADPKEFFDNRFLKELEDSGFVQELYGKR